MSSILITGASSGIGLATAKMFLRDGWDVGLLARREDVLADIARAYPRAVALPADVSDAATLEAAFQRFTDKVGHLDVLFNNAGIFTPPGLIDEIPLDDWYTSINVNLTGMFLAARLAFGIMRHQSPQGGRIINNGSVAAHVPRPLTSPYTTTKHAITGLTRSLSLDGRPFDIACGQIDIGNALTPMVQALDDRARQEGTEPPQSMPVDDAAAAVLHMAQLPLGSNIQFMTIMATKMPYIGRG